MKKTLFMSTYFTQHLLGPSGERYDYPRVKRWTKSRGKDINIFKYKQVFYPININNTHWCFVIALMKGKETSLPVCLDSTIRLTTNNNEWTRGLHRWINDEHLRIYGTQLEQKVPQNSLKIVIPQQVGGTDCGIFVLSAAEYAIKGFSIDQFDYSHKAMEFIRTKIAINLLNADISDNDDIDQDDHHVDFVNHLSDISDDEIDEESNSSGSDDETREEISSMIV